MKKKILRITGIILVLIVALLIAAPFFLEAKIGDLIKNNVNKNVNATLDFSKADLSLIRSFPNAEVRLDDLVFINKAPFAGDTLFAAKEVSLKMGITQLFKSTGDPISITRLAIDEALLHIKVDAMENANYDVSKETDAADSEAETATTEGFSFNMESYEIKNSRIFYDDYATGLHLELLEMNHSGTGDLSLETSELNTKTEALVSFTLDSTNYLTKNTIKLDALLGIDLKQNKYSFLKNDALLNQLPLVFEGFVIVNEKSQDVDISFKTPSSDFKNFLGVVPAAYSKDIQQVKTTGNFMVAGEFKGIVDETHIPTFHITVNSDNASFKYPELPKSVRNVFIDTEITNKTGIVEDTYVAVRKLSFMIDEDIFNMTATITELMGNAKVKAHVDGRMNLANISKAYPVPSDLNLKGLLNADVTTAFDMASIENKQYEKTNTSGNMSLRDFEYSSPEIPNPVQLSSAAVVFNPTTVTLNELNGVTGKTDFNATGSIDNLLGFMFNDEKVEGNFNLKSNTFALNDFMVATQVDSKDENTVKGEQQEKKMEEAIKIPSFLDANINASANTVLYDDLTLKNVSGNLRIKDEKAVLSNMTSALFDGTIAFNGEVSTKDEVPTFAMKLGMDQLQISETFKALELFKAVAPIAEILKGKLSSDIELAGNLTNDFAPDLLSLSGDILANILAREVDTDSAPLLSALGSKLNFLNVDDLNLKELKTKLSFKNGVVAVKPFTINYKDIAINIDGGHSFDRKMNYKATLDVPSKYLGKDVNSLIAKIDESELEGLTVPVTVNIGGNYTSPQVTTDFTSGVKSLTAQLVEIQKQKLLNKGKSKATDLIGGVLSGNSSADSTTTDKASGGGVKEVLGGLLGGKKKDSSTTKKDTVPEKKDAVKETAKDILGGLFGKKKKKDTVQ